jgi:hypothetical protein
MPNPSETGKLLNYQEKEAALTISLKEPVPEIVSTSM